MNKYEKSTMWKIIGIEFLVFIGMIAGFLLCYYTFGNRDFAEVLMWTIWGGAASFLLSVVLTTFIE